MRHLKRYMIIGIIFVLIAGTLSHFLYDWTGNNHIVGLFTPINESIWEHMKMLFFPMLVYSFFITFKIEGTFPSVISSLCFGILVGTLLLPILYYTYTSILGNDFFIIDIGIFVLCTVIAFRLSYKLTLSCRLEPYTILLCCLVLVLFICFILFTYHPPEFKIFEDPKVSQTAFI